jgi:two-component system, sensor histidine kinase PdtaS
MPTLGELAKTYTTLRGPAVEHLERLVGTWGMLADLCFSDLLLFVPRAVEEGDVARLIVVGQVRPSTSQTLHREDLVGHEIDEVSRPLVARAWRLGEIVEGEIVTNHGEPARVQCIPVRWQGQLVGVMTRESAALSLVRRQPGELERIYVSVFERFARMVVAGDFPFDSDDLEMEESPRVGDGALLLDDTGRVEYTSPNALNALHRMGINSSTDGMRLDELGVEEGAVKTAFATCSPVTVEIEGGVDVTVLLRCVPLLEQGAVAGALVLLRDVSDLRHRDRLILSKDVLIREIHHRVKNSLQTVSALFRLQARRLENTQARLALEEAERRIRAIARVHDVLSREVGEQVPFDELMPELLRMGEEAAHSFDRQVNFTRVGDPGVLSANVATPLALILTELLQNAGEHAFAGGDAQVVGNVRVEFDNDGTALEVRVSDDGVGLPADFSMDATRSLGLSIVRDLVRSQLNGTIDLTTPRTGQGTLVRLTIPLR